MNDYLISVVIPALNEELFIGRTVESVLCQAGPFEIIVADGGSTDQTACELSKYRAVTLVNSVRGRAVQMNTGASNAIGEVLLFLHADTVLPPTAFDLIRQSIRSGAGAGTFRLRFAESTGLLLRFSSWVTRMPLPSLCFGDRGLFVTRSAFDAVGGFPNVPIFEDLSIVKALRQTTQFAYLPASVTTSPRRFDSAGHWKQQRINTYLWLRYLRGDNPAELEEHYEYSRMDDPSPAGSSAASPIGDAVDENGRA